MRGDPMTPLLLSDSATARIVAPGGMVTRWSGASRRLQADNSVSAAHVLAMNPTLARATQDMLQQYGGRQRIDVSRPVLGLAAQLAHCSPRCGCRIALIHQFNGHARALFDLRCDAPHFGCPRRVGTASI